MSCTKLRNKKGNVIGFTCSFVQEQGRFLLWNWEKHEHMGVCWFITYPEFAWNDYKKYIKRRRKHFSRWTVFKEDVLLDFFHWFKITETHILPGRYNPLWLWYSFQKWYRGMLKK